MATELTGEWGDAPWCDLGSAAGADVQCLPEWEPHGGSHGCGAGCFLEISMHGNFCSAKQI